MNLPSKLRDYQVQAVDAIEEKWREHNSTMVCLPTGCGKTILFAEVIRRRQSGRALVLAHRSELIYQAVDKIERFAGLHCEVEMADQLASTSLYHQMPVVVATVQTLVSGRSRRRMERFDPMDFLTLVIDEFHHGTAASHRAVVDYFRAGNPDIKLLGVTATPDRADEEALGQVCQSVAFDYEIQDAIRDGWLVPIEQQLVTIEGLDFSSVRTTAGDLNGADLAAIMESEKAMQGLCGATLNIIGDRQTIVFASSVAHAEMACNIFNRHRAGIADWVCGATEKQQRMQTMKNVYTGKTQIIVNVGCLTEGFDAPGIEVVVMGRPTKSRSLFSQMAGRGTRPLPGVVDGPKTADARRAAIAHSKKPSCLIVDFVGNSGRHKLITTADILGGKCSEQTRELALEIIERKGGRGDMREALDEAEEEIQAKSRAAADAQRRLEEARKARLTAQVKHSSRVVDPFDAFHLEPDYRPDTSGKVLTQKQRELFQKHLGDPDKYTYTQAKRLLDAQFDRWSKNLCSMKQASLLNRHGLDGASFERGDAKRVIDAIVSNGWRLPTDWKKLVRGGHS